MGGGWRRVAVRRRQGGGRCGRRQQGVVPTHRNHPLTLTFSVRTRSTKAEATSASRWEPWKRQPLPCEACGRAIIEICYPDQEWPHRFNRKHPQLKVGQAGGFGWRKGWSQPFHNWRSGMAF